MALWAAEEEKYPDKNMKEEEYTDKIYKKNNILTNPNFVSLLQLVL